MSGDIMAFLPLIVPIIGAVAIYTISEENKRARLALAYGVILVNVFIVWSLFFSVYGGKNISFRLVRLLPGLEVSFTLDPLGMVFAITASTLWIFAIAYASGYLAKKKNQRQFYFWYILSMTPVLGVAFAGNLFTFYIFFEFLTFATYPLVIQEGTNAAHDSGKKYIFYCLSGGALILIAFLILHSVVPPVEFVTGGIVSTVVVEKNVLILVLILMIAGFGTKAAVLPLHSWLPGAMVAPVPVSALFHAVAVVKSGVFGVVRTGYFIFNPELVEALDPNNLIPIFFSITIILASIIALKQNVLKLRLAYSTISQLGYITLGAFLFSSMGMLGGVIHLVNHAFLKIILFFCAGIVMKETGASKVDEMEGIGKRLPLTMTCFAIAGLGLIGILPINGYISKLYILQGSIEADKAVFALVILASSLLNSFYYLPIMFNAFFRKGDYEKTEAREAPASMLVPIVILALICLGLGLFAHKTTIPLVEQVVDQAF